MIKKKKTPVKRKYTKKATKWTKKDSNEAIRDIEQIEPDFSALTPKADLDEIEFLDAVVTGVAQMTNEQKSRFMNYIYSRYWQFITLSKLTQ